MAVCRACGKIIDFIRTPAGKFMPVDCERIPIDIDGGSDNFITERGEFVFGRRISPREAEAARYNGETLEMAYIPHWVTCSSPGRFRKKYEKKK